MPQRRTAVLWLGNSIPRWVILGSPYRGALGHEIAQGVQEHAAAWQVGLVHSSGQTTTELAQRLRTNDMLRQRVSQSTVVVLATGTCDDPRSPEETAATIVEIVEMITAMGAFVVLLEVFACG